MFAGRGDGIFPTEKLRTISESMLDRLTHRVHILEANGESYRLQDARKRHRKSKGG